jgi:hypothetical protein
MTKTLRIAAAALPALWLAGCGTEPGTPKTPAGVAAVGTGYFAPKTSGDALAPVGEIPKRSYTFKTVAATGSAGEPFAGTPGGSTTPPAGTTTTPPPSSFPGGSGTPPSTGSVPPVDSPLLAGNATAELAKLGTPTDSHRLIAFALADGAAMGASAKHQGNIRGMGMALKAAWPYVLAKLNPGLSVTAADADVFKADVQIKTAKAAEAEDGDYAEVLALLFGTDGLTMDNKLFQALGEATANGQPMFPGLGVSAVQDAARAMGMAIAPNAKAAGIEAALPDSLKMAPPTSSTPPDTTTPAPPAMPAVGEPMRSPDEVAKVVESFNFGAVPEAAVFSDRLRPLQDPRAMGLLQANFGKPRIGHFKVANIIGEIFIKAPGAQEDCKMLGEVIQAMFGYVLAASFPAMPDPTEEEIKSIREYLSPLVRDMVRDGTEVSTMREVVFGADNVSDGPKVATGKLSELGFIKSRLQVGDNVAEKLRDNTRKLFELVTPFAEAAGVDVVITKKRK